MAANVAYVYIYSNDGAQVLHEYLTGANLLTVTDKGCLYNDSVEWTYTGTNTFLGFATSPNAVEPTYAIGDSVSLTLGGSDAFYIVERETASSSVTVEYNGSVVATIENGNKATLPIKDLKMKSDLVVTVPEATDSPLPIEVATEAEMTALLESGEVGGVYKYVGESTAVYEKGALYILEEAGYSLTINSAEAYNMGDDTVAYFKVNGSASETDYDFKFEGYERSYTFSNAEGSSISLPFTIRDISTLGILCEYGSVTLADTNTNTELIYVSAWDDANSGELSLGADTSVNIQHDFCD